MALAVLTAAAALIMFVDGDPLPAWATWCATLAGTMALACVVVAELFPVPWGRMLWPLSAAVLIYTFMCVRGRILAAWLGCVANSLVGAAWAAYAVDDPIVGGIMNYADYVPLLMSTFFALTIRPAAATIFALRERSSDEVTREAAARAALEERDAQLRRLDELARPLLRRIAAGHQLSLEERAACALLEAQLRDSLRARVLVDDKVNAAVRSARSAGTEVVLLDDGDDEDAGEPLRAALLGHLAEIHGGKMIARVLPPGRATAMTVLVTGTSGGHEETERYEYDTAGALVGPDADERRC